MVWYYHTYLKGELRINDNKEYGNIIGIIIEIKQGRRF